MSDRAIIYPGQIPQDADLLSSNKFAHTALAKAVAAAFGVAPIVNGLAVTQSIVPNMQVAVAPGEIYTLANLDSTSYGSLAADTTHQVMKQGILMDGISLGCAAPGTVGFSINYLIQAAFNEADVGSVALPYYNASNPSVAWSGPANSGTPQATTRQDQCVVTVKAGAAAATGTQATPAPDAGNVGLVVVTVAYGAATIVNANISQYVGASLVPQNGLASNVAHAIYSKSVAGAANVVLTAQEAAFPILTLTGVLTGNINVTVPAVSRQWIISNQTSGAFQITVKTAAGTGIVAPQGLAMSMFCDAVNVYSSVSALLTQAAADLRYGSSQFSIGATVSANALTGTLNPCKLDFRNASLTNGAPVISAIASALSLVVPSTATLGTIAATAARLVWLVAYNGGAPVLCVTNLAGGLNLDETTLISPTTISATADLSNVIYSASAVSANSPFRVVGFSDITEATPGTWATAPTTVQGIGGLALPLITKGYTLLAEVALSGTSVDLLSGASIPSWATKIHIMLDSLQTSVTSPAIIQVGPAGGAVATGYLGIIGSGALITKGLGITNPTATAEIWQGRGEMSLAVAASNKWSFSSVVGRTDAAAVQAFGIGTIALSGPLAKIVLTTVNGTDTLSGNVAIAYE